MPAAARIIDRPVERLAETYGDYLNIVTHPAFRLGFLDALTGRTFNHEKIMERITRETPGPSLALRRWCMEVAFTQYRYEEGRMFVVEYGLKSCNWRFPESPPAQVKAWIERRLAHGR